VHGRWHRKLAIEFGGGWNIAADSTRTTQTCGWDYIMGAGYNFNRHLALLGERSFNRFTIPPIIAPNFADSSLNGDTTYIPITAGIRW